MFFYLLNVGDFLGLLVKKRMGVQEPFLSNRKSRSGKGTGEVLMESLDETIAVSYRSTIFSDEGN